MITFLLNRTYYYQTSYLIIMILSGKSGKMHYEWSIMANYTEQLERHDDDGSLGSAEAENEELHPRTY